MKRRICRSGSFFSHRPEFPEFPELTGREVRGARPGDDSSAGFFHIGILEQRPLPRRSGQPDSDLFDERVTVASFEIGGGVADVVDDLDSGPVVFKAEAAAGDRFFIKPGMEV